MAGRSAIFLDRDGVINQDRSDYVKSWEEFAFIPAALEGLKRLAASEFALVIISNQSAVGRGLLTMAQMTEINRRMIAEIEAYGGRVDAIYCCPHAPDAGCDCRKPKPGMLRQAEREMTLDLPASFLVGDSLRDIATAHAVGVRGILVRTGHGEVQAPRLAEHPDWNCPVVADLQAAADYILSNASRRI